MRKTSRAGIQLTKRPAKRQSMAGKHYVANKSTQADWGDAPLGAQFYGRAKELVKLKKWIKEDNCRLLTLVGMGGIGKTSIAVALVEQVKDSFAYIIWRSLKNAPLLNIILQDCIQFFSDQRLAQLPQSIDDQIRLLIDYLDEHRCLLVLDNVEAVLQGGTPVGEYQKGYEGYGQLFDHIGLAHHQSCILLTSREKPREIALLQGPSLPVRSYELKGLRFSDGQKILRDKGLVGSKHSWQNLVNRYVGNPLALKLVSQFILDIYNGDLDEFLRRKEVLFTDIGDVLDEQFDRLSIFEQEIMYCLAIAREAITLDEIYKHSIQAFSIKPLVEALRSLRRRFLIEMTTSGSITLQNVVMEYVTERLVDSVFEEIKTGHLSLLKSHALMYTQAKDYVRQSQIRVVLLPLERRLQKELDPQELHERFENILALLRNQNSQHCGYAIGNILNFLIQLGYDPRKYDFSHLVVRQAHLQGISLVDVNFAYSQFIETDFTDTFAGILSVSYNPQGNILIGGTSTAEIRAWRTTDGSPLFTCSGHSDCVWSLAFHPDSSIFASASGDQTVRLWETNTGRCLKILRGHTGRVWFVLFSPDGKLLASGAEDRTLRLWDINSGECIRILQGHTSWVVWANFSSDASSLLSISDDSKVCLWDVNTGNCLKALLESDIRAKAVAYDFNRRILAISRNDQIILLRDIDTDQNLRVLQGHTDGITSVIFSPNGKLIASGSADKTVRFWDVKTGRCLRILQGHTEKIRSIAFNSKGTQLATGSDDQTLRWWQTNTGNCIGTAQGYNNWARCIAYSFDGNYLASGYEDSTLRLWDVNTGESLRIWQGHRNRVRTIGCSPTEGILASGSDDLTVRLWSMSTGECLRTLLDHTGWILSVTFNSTGRLLATSSDDRTIRLWEIDTGQCIQILQGHTDGIRSVDFSLDNSLLVSCSNDQTIRIWKVPTGECLKVIYGHSAPIRLVTFSPDGLFFASAGDDGSIKLWETTTGECIKVLPGLTTRYGLTFSPDGQFLASGGNDNNLLLWLLSTGQQRMLCGHTRGIHSVAYSTDGNIIASSSFDGTIRLWNSLTGICLKILRYIRPYERMNITGVQGLTDNQKSTLKVLGALDDVQGKDPKRGPVAKQARDQIFISYSHKDKKWLDRLETTIKPLIRSGRVKTWSDIQIEPGTEWLDEIRRALALAKVAVLLVTPNYLASEFIVNHELLPLLKAAEEDGLTILWVAVSASMYRVTEVAKYQAANDPSKPLESLTRAEWNKELVRIGELIEKEVVT